MAAKSRSPYQNQALAEAIETRYHTIYRFCAKEDLDLIAVTSLLCATTLPLKNNGEFTQLATKLLKILQIPALKLFPPDIYINAIEMPLEPEIKSLAHENSKDGPAREIMNTLPPLKLEQLLMAAKLTFFEREVVCLRYGYDDVFPGCHDIKAIARSLRKTPEEILVLEQSAAAKLKAAEQVH